MARKLDHHAATLGTSLDLPYRSDALAALVRLMTTFSNARFQSHIVNTAALPEDPHAIPALFAIATNAANSPSSLAIGLHCSPATASRVIDRLAAHRLVARVAHPDDRRATQLELTASGAEQARAVFAAGDHLMERLLEGWSWAEREQFTSSLTRFAAALDHETQRAAHS